MTPFLRSISYLILLLPFIIASSLHAREIVVPTDYRTIQNAIDRAEPNDTIIVEDGFYNENIKINKTLTLLSRNGYDKTVIEAKQNDEDVLKVVDINGVEIIGFTVKGSEGAGIHLIRANNSKISSNSAAEN